MSDATETIQRLLKRSKLKRRVPRIHYWKRILKEIKRRKQGIDSNHAWFCFIDAPPKQDDNQQEECDKKVSKRYVIDEGAGIYLTRREAQCVAFLARGKSRLELTDLLNISFRTLETYLESTRKKLDCISTKQLIHFVMQSDFAKAIPRTNEEILKL